MKNYFKKFSIMFLMLLAIIGVGVIQDGNVANAAMVGGQLVQPEEGWKRYDDCDVNIKTSSKIPDIYSGFMAYKEKCYNSTISSSKYEINSQNEYYSFNFYGSKLRIISPIWNSCTPSVNVYIDNVLVDNFSEKTQNNKFQALVYEIKGLDLTIHSVKLVNGDNTGKYFCLDAIDIDKEGKLFPYSVSKQSISLDNTSINLEVNDSKQLTATTTPEAAQVNWSSSDESVATVDSNGKVTGVKEGQATITATINDGSNVSAACTVTIVPKTTEPTEPQDPTGDGTLFIELVDGNIKSYDVSSQEITNFINWYKNRDLDDSQSPVYKFKKDDYTDYVVHDKIDWFEVR